MIEFYKDKDKKNQVSQGDIFSLSDSEVEDYFPFLLKTEWATIINFIVTSYTCDIQHNRIKYICISPIIKLKPMLDDMATKKKNNGAIKKNIEEKVNNFVKDLHIYKLKEYFYLPKDENYDINEDYVVLLEILLPQKFEEFITIIKKTTKCSLMSPWREKLGWKIGYLYNRIALDEFSEKLRNEITEATLKTIYSE